MVVRVAAVAEFLFVTWASMFGDVGVKMEFCGGTERPMKNKIVVSDFIRNFGIGPIKKEE